MGLVATAKNSNLGVCLENSLFLKIQVTEVRK